MWFVVYTLGSFQNSHQGEYKIIVTAQCQHGRSVKGYTWYTYVRAQYVAKAQYVTILLRIGFRMRNLTGFLKTRPNT